MTCSELRSRVQWMWFDHISLRVIVTSLLYKKYLLFCLWNSFTNRPRWTRDNILQYAEHSLTDIVAASATIPRQ